MTRTPNDGRRPADVFVAVNHRIFRRYREVTQSGLAEEMTDLGHRWTAATVGDIENRGRSVRIGELVDLAEVLSIPLTAFLADPRLRSDAVS
jgi:hypothetical protein